MFQGISFYVGRDICWGFLCWCFNLTKGIFLWNVYIILNFTIILMQEVIWLLAKSWCKTLHFLLAQGWLLMQFQILPFKIKFTASWNGSHRPPRLWFLSEFLKCLSTPTLGTAWNNYTWWEVLMPLTLPATHLHTGEKFMCQLPGVLLPGWILPTPPGDHPPRRESACSFITAIPQLRFIPKRRRRCGGEVCKGGEGTAGHGGASGIAGLQDWGKAGGENRGSRQCVEKVCWEVDLGI